MRTKLASSTILAAFLALTLSSPASAQDAKQVLQEAMDRYTQRLANVDNFTVVQDVMGF